MQRVGVAMIYVGPCCGGGYVLAGMSDFVGRDTTRWNSKRQHSAMPRFMVTKKAGRVSEMRRILCKPAHGYVPVL